jgi:RNA recognition motif. (a.k.a. RRM, RBD, or RNP domain)
MNRLRKGGRPPPGFGEESSDDEDDDPFAVMSSKGPNKSSNNKKLKTNDQETPASSMITDMKTVSTSSKMKTSILDDSVISSDLVDTTVVATIETTNANAKLTTKRHHSAISDTRKAKMDALLLELQSVDNLKTNRSNLTTGGRNVNIESNNQPHQQHAYPPYGMEKKGSFVDPSEEHETTNIFIGNLAPSITEEEMTELFRQFGKETLSFSMRKVAN